MTRPLLRTKRSQPDSGSNAEISPTGIVPVDGCVSRQTRMAYYPVISATELLNGGEFIDIEHEGKIYRLSVTSLNKLLLTAAP